MEGMNLGDTQRKPVRPVLGGSKRKVGKGAVAFVLESLEHRLSGNTDAMVSESLPVRLLLPFPLLST